MALECKKKNIAITYDLAIAKMALKIQAEEAPTFDNVFVALGAFHMEMSFFGVIGKYIAESGGPYLLNECHIIEKGSLPSFLSGKGYKRNKRVHQLLALAMETLHFKSFQLLLDEEDLQVTDDLKTFLLSNKSEQELSECNLSREGNNLLIKYHAFVEDTKNGHHGLTAKYWMGYIEMMHLYHEFARSFRTGDLDLYIYCLPRLASYFFTFNHHNYARWLVIYHDNLLKLKETHPEVYNDFQNGCFSLKRTSKSFSRLPIDLTLEQTVNADAACQRSGITALTNSISARQRWAQSHSLRVTIISKVFEELDLSRKEDVSEDLKPHRIKQNCKDLEKLIRAVTDTMNPFSDSINKVHLFNISTGKAANEDTTNFLLSVKDVGTAARNDFIQSCNNNPNKFSQAIKRQKIKTFATEAGKYKISSSTENKLVSVAMTRDLFGSILFHALQSKVDMAEALKYPLTPVPLSLSHADGMMQKTPKVKLLNELEKKVKTVDPRNVNTTIIDGMFFLHLFVDLPSTFGSVASYILRRVCKQKGNEIHLVFDKTIKPSIKDCERDKRSENRSIAYQITGAEQKRPGNWLQALRKDQFKEALVDFLTSHWKDDLFSSILDTKKLFVNCGDMCYSFIAEEGKMVRKIEQDYFCTHEEADSRMIFHLKQLNTPVNVVIRTVDTDVLIIALGCMHLLDPGKKVWLEAGLYTKNSLRYISINQLFQHCGESLCRALPGYHAFTGCDYTASFNRKGKVRPLKLLEKNDGAQEVLSRIGNWHEISDADIQVIESFVCSIYGKKTFMSVDEARLDMFLNKYKPKGNNDSLVDHMKKMDASSLPPCSNVLLEKMKRTSYVTSLWQSCVLADAPLDDPLSFGWLMHGERYQLKWFEGDVAPKIVDVVKDELDEEGKFCINPMIFILSNFIN